MTRGVDLDAIAISPQPEIGAISAAIADAVKASGFEQLASIDEIRLDTLMEWHVEGERCIAITNPKSNWRVVYDTQFSHGALAEAIARALPELRVVQFNLQEQVDFTFRILRGENTLYEYSNAPTFFNWGRCIGQGEPAQLARPELPALAAALGVDDASGVLSEAFKIIQEKRPGEAQGTRGRKKGGVYDAAQTLAQHAGIPRLYRFFEGWMKSSLDWDEDGVETVLAFRKM